MHAIGSSASQPWVQVFVVGNVMYFGLLFVVLLTGGLGFIPPMILIGAFLIPVTFVTCIYGRQISAPIPVPLVAICFVVGGTIGAIIAGLLEFETRRALGVLPTLGIGVIEESAKLLFPLALFLFARYRLVSHGLLIGVATGMGFAALEFLTYVTLQLAVAAISLTLLIRRIREARLSGPETDSI